MVSFKLRCKIFTSFLHYSIVRFFVSIFPLLFLQCQYRNDVEEYNSFIKESNLDLMQINALKQMDYIAESSIEAAKKQ